MNGWITTLYDVTQVTGVEVRGPGNVVCDQGLIFDPARDFFVREKDALVEWLLRRGHRLFQRSPDESERVSRIRDRLDVLRLEELSDV